MGTDTIIDSENDNNYTCYHTSGSAQVGLVLQGATVPLFPCPQSPLILFLGTQSITALFSLCNCKCRCTHNPLLNDKFNK